jgi:2-polyprenyl-3-methyl-5-hydroxy-6-metoxy-1,4-benzoquinol methylase
MTQQQYAQERQSMDTQRAEKFVERLVGVINDAALALMTSIGHRTRLFDVMDQHPGLTSAQLAERAGLSERYVREWLGAMVTGGIVEHDPAAGTYTLPPEHAAALTRQATPNNMAATMQWISVLGAVEDRVVEAFRDGRGVPYSAYGRFHEVMAEESAQTTVAGLDKHIIPLVPGLRERLNAGIDVLDVGCGRGRAMMELARLFPKSRFTGYDFSEEAISAANAEARLLQLGNVRFVRQDAAEISDKQAFDLITAFDAIHDQARPAQVLERIRAALRPDGWFLMQDIAACSHVHHNIDNPLGPFIYTISCMHCMSVSLASGGAGLGAAWGKELAVQMLRDAGFGDVRVERLEHDPLNYYYVIRP